MHVFGHALLYACAPYVTFVVALVGLFIAVALADPQGRHAFVDCALVFLGPVALGFTCQPLLRRVPARCPSCGGRARPHRPRGRWRIRFGVGGGGRGASRPPLVYDCDAGCGTIEPWRLAALPEVWRRRIIRLSIVWRLPFLLFLAWAAVVMMGGMGAPFVIAMFVLAYAIGALLQLLVRLVPQPAPENQPAPWRDFLVFAAGTLFVVVVVIALGRAVVLSPHVAQLAGGHVPVVENRLLAPLAWFDWTLGGCALAYALLGPGRESLSLLGVLARARRVPVAEALAGAPRVVVVSGVARAAGDEATIVDHDFAVLWDGRLLESRLAARPFTLEDQTGRIPVEVSATALSVVLPAPFSVLGLARPASAVLALNWGVERSIWPNRRVALRDGDPVLVAGRLQPAVGGAASAGFVARGEAARHGAVGPFLSALRPRRPRWAREPLLVAGASDWRGQLELWWTGLLRLGAAGLWLLAGGVLLGEPLLSLRAIVAPPRGAVAEALRREPGPDLDVRFELEKTEVRGGDPVVVRFSQPLAARPGERYWLAVVERTSPEGAWSVGTAIYGAEGASEAVVPAPRAAGLWEVRLHARYPSAPFMVVHRAPLRVLPLLEAR